MYPTYLLSSATMSNNDRGSGGSSGSMDRSFAIEDATMKAGDLSQKKRQEAKKKKEEEAEAKRKYDAGQASLSAGDVSQSRRKNKEKR